MPTDTEQLARDILATIVKPSSESQAMLRMRKDMDQLAQAYLDMKKERDEVQNSMEMVARVNARVLRDLRAKLKAAEEALDWIIPEFYEIAMGKIPGAKSGLIMATAKAALATIRAKEPTDLGSSRGAEHGS